MQILLARLVIALSSSLPIGLAACADAPAKPDVTLPDVSAAAFVAGVDHAYFPLPVGAKWTYEGDTEEGHERIVVEVQAETRVVHGVTAVVVRDQAFVDDVLVEDTNDWYAQDADGNVWYLGEDTCEVKDGACASHDGAWEWGVDGALPGIIMPAHPAVDGVLYFQEFYAGQAEDFGEIVALDVAITVPQGSFTDCVKTRDRSRLESDVVEFKTYCRGMGIAREDEEEGHIDLMSATGL